MTNNLVSFVNDLFNEDKYLKVTIGFLFIGLTSVL